MQAYSLLFTMELNAPLAAMKVGFTLDSRVDTPCPPLPRVTELVGRPAVGGHGVPTLLAYRLARRFNERFDE